MKTPMIVATILTATAVAGLGFAYAAGNQDQVVIKGAEVGTYIGKTEAESRTALEAKGFVVTAVEVEPDELEFEVKKDGQSYEIEIDPTSGKISETEREDDDH